ncbi:MAG: flagellar basal body protein [Acidobacteriota bacterium]
MSLDRVGLQLGSYLTYLSRRQEVIASNIANADTPGYHTLDIASVPAFSSVFAQLAPQAEEAPGLPARNDGNNVSMDREARLLSENSLKFSLATQMLRGEIKDIRSAIEEGRAQ